MEMLYEFRMCQQNNEQSEINGEQHLLPIPSTQSREMRTAAACVLTTFRSIPVYSVQNRVQNAIKTLKAISIFRIKLLRKKMPQRI